MFWDWGGGGGDVKFGSKSVVSEDANRLYDSGARVKVGASFVSVSGKVLIIQQMADGQSLQKTIIKSNIGNQTYNTNRATYSSTVARVHSILWFLAPVASLLN